MMVLRIRALYVKESRCRTCDNANHNIRVDQLTSLESHRPCLHGDMTLVDLILIRPSSKLIAHIYSADLQVWWLSQS